MPCRRDPEPYWLFPLVLTHCKRIERTSKNATTTGENRLDRVVTMRASTRCECRSAVVKSGVLLGTEIALIVDAFGSRAALVVLAIGRHTGRRAILVRGIRRVSVRWRDGNGAAISAETGRITDLLFCVARATFARVTCGPAQCGMSHVDASCVQAVTRRWRFYSLGIAA
jgi:hypothetical protein